MKSSGVLVGQVTKEVYNSSFLVLLHMPGPCSLRPVYVDYAKWRDCTVILYTFKMGKETMILLAAVN